MLKRSSYFSSASSTSIFDEEFAPPPQSDDTGYLFAKESIFQKAKNVLNKYFSKRTKWEILTVAIIYASYASLLAAKSSLDVTLPQMLDDKKYLGHAFNKEFATKMIGFGTGAFFIGKPLFGLFIDHYGGRNIFLAELIGVAACTGLFGMLGGMLSVFFPDLIKYNKGICIPIILIVIWSLNRFLLGGAWQAMTSIVSAWFDKDRWGSVFGILSTSGRVGSIVASLLFGSLLHTFKWRGIFLLASVCVFMLWSVSHFCLYASPKKAGLSTPKPTSAKKSRKYYTTLNDDNDEEVETVDEEETAIPREKGAGLRAVTAPSFIQRLSAPIEQMSNLMAMLKILTNARFWLLCTSQLCYTVIFELVSFFPIYLKESLNLKAGVASSYCSLFGIGALSVVLFGIAYDKIQKLPFGRMVMMLVASFVGTGSAIALWLLPNVGLYFTLASIFTLGFVSSPGFYLPVSVYSVQFGSTKHCAKISAFVDVVAYLGTMLFDFAAGIIIERHGWNLFFMIVTICTAMGGVSQGAYQLLDVLTTKISTFKKKPAFSSFL